MCLRKWWEEGTEGKLDSKYTLRQMEHKDVHVHAQSLSRVQLSETLWTIAHKVPLSMGFSRQEYWNG